MCDRNNENAKQSVGAAYDEGFDDGYNHGREVAKFDGHQEGYNEGFVQGSNESYDDGFVAGHNEGYDDGLRMARGAVDRAYKEGYAAAIAFLHGE